MPIRALDRLLAKLEAFIHAATALWCLVCKLLENAVKSEDLSCLHKLRHLFWLNFIHCSLVIDLQMR